MTLGVSTLHPREAAPSRAAPNSTNPSSDFAVLATYGLMLSALFGPLMSMSGKAGSTGEGNILRQLIYLGVFIAAIGCTRKENLFRRIFPAPLSLTITVAWCWITLLWAHAPDIALRRVSLMTIIVMSVFMLASALKPSETIEICKKTLIFILVANFFAVIFFPAFAIHRAAEIAEIGMDPNIVGSWKGMLMHKNSAGPVAAITIIIFALDPWPVNLLLRSAVILASSVFLFYTNSKTSMNIGAISLFIGWIFRAYNPNYRAVLIPLILAFLVCVFMVGWIEWDEIAKPFNRPEAFSGRVQIWSASIGYWRDHPWGSGYGSFWNVGADKLIAHYVNPKNWVAALAEGHNGYLDLLVQIGTFGFFLAMASLLVIPLSKLIVRGTPTQSEGSLLIAILIFCAGSNLMESSFLERDAIVEVFLLLAIALIERTTTAARPHAMRNAAF